MGALKSVSFAKYKAFDTMQKLELRPITLLFGHNSVGKSAALRLLPVLSDSALADDGRTYTSSVIDYSSAALRGATFLDLVSKGSKAGTLSFELEWLGWAFTFAIKQTSSPRAEFVSSFAIVGNDGTLRGSATDPSTETFELVDEEHSVEARVHFEGLRPVVLDPIPSRMKAAIAAVSQLLQELSSSVHWIAAVRAQRCRRGDPIRWPWEKSRRSVYLC